ADKTARVPPGNRSDVLRCHCRPLGAVHGSKSAAGSGGLVMAAAWERLPGESSQAYAAFCLYHDLGSGRSIDAASRAYHQPRQGGDATSTAPRRRASGRIRKWAARWNWSARAGAWDQELGRVQRAKQLEAIEEMAERQVKEAMMLQAKAVERLRQLR